MIPPVETLRTALLAASAMYRFPLPFKRHAKRQSESVNRRAAVYHRRAQNAADHSFNCAVNRDSSHASINRDVEISAGIQCHGSRIVQGGCRSNASVATIGAPTTVACNSCDDPGGDLANTVVVLVGNIKIAFSVNGYTRGTIKLCTRGCG